MRESSRLFSFKSDSIPKKAWENPKFAHLKDQWSFRQLEDSERSGSGSVSGSGGSEKQPSKGGGGGSFGKRAAALARTPSLPSLREQDGASSPEMVRDASERLEDPFTPANGSARERAGFAQLSITSERIYKSVNQTKENVDTLLEGHVATAKGVLGLQEGVDKITQQVDELALRQQTHDEVFFKMQSVIEESASQVRDLHERPLPAIPSPESFQIQGLQAEIEQNSAQLKTLLDKPQPVIQRSTSLKDLQVVVSQNSEQLRTLIDRPQHDVLGEESMRQLQTEISRNSAQLDKLIDGPQPDATSPEAFEKLQAEVSQNSAHLKALLDGQRTAKKSMQKMQTILDHQAANQKMLVEQVQAVHASNLQNQALIKSLAQSQDARFEKLMSALERQAAQTREAATAQQEVAKSALERQAAQSRDLATKQQTAVKSARDEIIAAMNAAAVCDHDIIPPPRKVNRKLVGYVYSRNGS